VRGGAPRGGLRDRPGTLAAILIAPAVLYICALIGVPLVVAVLLSVSDATTGELSRHYAGAVNYRNALADPVFRLSLKNTFVFALLSQSVVIVLSRLLASALLRPFRGKRLVRFLVLLPWTAPIALGAIGWLWMYDSIYSPFDWLYRRAGLLGTPGALLGPMTNVYWLGRPLLAMASVATVHVWRLLPLATVIQIAGLSSIPAEIVEAAEIDGAHGWRRALRITLPLTLPVVGVAFLFGIVFTFTDMTVVYVLTRGGPVNATQVLATWTFFKGIEGGDLAQGAAISLFMFPVLAGVAALLLRTARRAVVT
jgi:multiple sugar transport system permease protein